MLKTVYEHIGWIHLAQYKVLWLAFENKVMTLHVPRVYNFDQLINF